MRVAAFVAAVLLVSACSLVAFAQEQDIYSILGLKKNANIREIKKAYKSLVKEWHPDKSTDPAAQEKFMQIQKAYEILSDPEKKERYDKFGTMDDSPQMRGAHFHDQFDHFHSFFGGGFQDDFFSKQRITMRQYTHNILDRSKKQPYLVFVYSTYCHACFHFESMWKDLTNDLEPLGYGMATINAMLDGNLLDKLRVHSMPSILAIVDGRSIQMRIKSLHSITARTVREFARDTIPAYVMTRINSHDKLTRFVDLWKTTNKASVLVFGSTEKPTIRFLLAAMRFSSFARFGYVHLGEPTAEITAMKEALSIKCSQCENILIFNEQPEKGPIARHSISNAKQLTKEAIDTFIQANMLLSLPRLSSTDFLDELCPVSSRNSRHLCVILPISSSDVDSKQFEAYTEYVKKSADYWKNQFVHFTYLFTDKQMEWIRPYLEANGKKIDTDNEKPNKNLLVIWRIEYVKSRFVWLNDAWTGDEQRVYQAVQGVVEGNTRLDNTQRVNSMVDEHAPTIWTRMSRAAVQMAETLWFYVNKEEAYPFLSAVGTLFIILGIGQLLSYVNKDSTKKPKVQKSNSDEWIPDDPKDAAGKYMSEKAKEAQLLNRQQKIYSAMCPLMHELRAETYFGMIRLLKPGCRSLVLLVDEENKERLLRQFAQYIFPIRNNKTFSFGYLVVDKNLAWFRKLLEHTLPSGETAQVGKNGDEGQAIEEQGGAAAQTLYARLKSINPRQTVGTVLALCGWKLYFSIYHPMHSASKKKHFLGFDSDDSDSDQEVATKEEKAMLHFSSRGLCVDNVLDAFPLWLDRLLEGSIRRYYIPEWPDNLK
ncbi:hypothetical protein WR25_14894 [Diploscapter pachys]|uniref:J domain-containing protein n=1 Tax=Diploscapter pachys TaxID=2018661 RepID=A0A2A2LV28_9BILA|nr:hypothetical protein WR25_14894 [Diploscapter pachys]